MTAATKNPERVRLGRLGALSVHARGRTNTGPARAAWEANLVAEVDPDGSLEPAELERRLQYALRVRMTRLAMARWGKKVAGPRCATGPARTEGGRRAPDVDVRPAS